MSPRGSGHRERTRPQAVEDTLKGACGTLEAHVPVNENSHPLASSWGLQTAVAKAAHQALPALGERGRVIREPVELRDPAATGHTLRRWETGLGWWGAGWGGGGGWNHSVRCHCLRRV